MKDTPPVLPGFVKAQYRFDYRLSYDEAYETFINLASRWSGKKRMAISVILALLAVGLLIGYFLDSQKIHYFFLAILAIGLLYYAVYVPVLKAKKGAAKVAKQKGTYKVTLTAGGEILLPRQDDISLAGDKDSRAIETSDIFIIRSDRINTFCLPKRMMQPEEIDGVREILKAYLKFQTR